MYDIDVIALVSYDQVQFTDGSFLSLTYWTIVGAYVVAGEKNDTSTMLDLTDPHKPSKYINNLAISNFPNPILLPKS